MSTDHNPGNPYEYYEPIPYKEIASRLAQGRFSLEDYVDSTSITTFVLILLVLCILLNAMGIYADFRQVGVIENIRAGVYETEEAQQAAAEAVDELAGLVAVAQIGVTLLLGVVFLFWTHRVCKNAHCLSLSPLKITPGWAVGWYFIPFANLWMPYTALNEAYVTSRNVDYSRPRIETAPLIFLWWIVHLIFVVISQISFQVSRSLTRHSGIDEWLTAKWLTIVAEGVSIPLNILTIVVVLVFVKCQREGFERRNNDYR